MNLKFLALISSVLIALIAILGGTYYYLFGFENSKETKQSFEYKSSSIIDTSSQTSNITPQISENNKTNSGFNLQNTQETKTEISQLPAIEKETKSDTAKINSFTQENKISQGVKIEKEQANTQHSSMKNESKKSEKQDKSPFNSYDLQAKKSYANAMKEYQQRGRDSRLEKALSNETIKVYVMDGKALSDYRIGLLKDLLNPIYERSQDYNLSVFVQMLPNQQMNLRIYNKDIIFSNKRKLYQYITLKDIAPYINDLETLNSKIKREQVIKRMEFLSKEEGKGSEFSRHLKDLKNGIFTAQFFFPFSEIIEISTKQ